MEMFSPPASGVKIVVEDNNRLLAMLRRGEDRFLADFVNVELYRAGFTLPTSQSQNAIEPVDRRV